MSQLLTRCLTFLKSIQGDCTIDELYSINTVLSALHSIQTVLDVSPKIIPKQFDNLQNLFHQLLCNRQEAGILALSFTYGILVGIIEKYPKLLTKHKARQQLFLNGAIEVIACISLTTSQDWLNPKEGVTEDDLYDEDEDFQASREMMNIFQQYAQNIGYQQIRLKFQIIFKQYTSRTDDWRYTYACLLLASQLGEDYEQLQQFNTYIDCAIKSLNHSEPKVRYAALQLIGQYSDDLKPLFQQNYFDTVMPVLMKTLYDNAPRVVSHSFACLNNFFDHFQDFWKIQHCLNQILVPVFQYINTGSSWLKQNSLSVLESLAGIKGTLNSHMVQILEVLNRIITTYVGKQDYQNLVCLAFQTLGTLLSCQQKTITAPYLPQSINLMLTYRQNINKQSFMNAWTHFCLEHSNFTDLSIIFPYILENIKLQISENSLDASVQAIICMIHTSQSFKINFKPYFEVCYNLLKDTMKNIQNLTPVRQKAREAIISLIKDLNKENAQSYNQWFQISIQTLAFFLEKIEINFSSNEQWGDTNQLEGYFLGVNELIKQIGSALKTPDIMNLVTKLHDYQFKIQNLFKPISTIVFTNADSDQNDEQNKYEQEDQDQDDDDISLLSEESDIQKVMEIIPDIYTSLLEVAATDEKSSIISFMITQISTAISKQEDQWKLFGLNLAASLVQKCSYDELQKLWPQLMTLFENYSCNGFTRLRNISVYGMSNIFLKTPLQLVNNQNIQKWLNLLSVAIQNPFTKGQQIKYSVDFAKDNVISSLGSLLKSFGASFPLILNKYVYKKWLSFLPLNTDIKEGDEQQLILIQLMNTNPGLLVQDINDLMVICLIYAKFINKRSSGTEYDDIKNKTKESIRQMSQWPLFQQHSDFLWNGLSHSQRTALGKLLKN